MLNNHSLSFFIKKNIRTTSIHDKSIRVYHFDVIVLDDLHLKETVNIFAALKYFFIGNACQSASISYKPILSKLSRCLRKQGIPRGQNLQESENDQRERRK